MKLNKKWGIVGIISMIGGFFAHPDACVNSRDVLTKVLPHTPEDALTHIGVILGGILLALSKGILEKKETKEIE